MKIKKERGFTLIELMIVVAIIGILAAIAIPQFASLIAKSQEGATKGSLGAVRSSLSIYYGDMEGVYPQDSLVCLTSSQKYLASLPNITIPNNKTFSSGHGGATNGVVNALSDTVGGGGWFYQNSSAAQTWGTVLVNCTHSDVKGSSWSSY